MQFWMSICKDYECGDAFGSNPLLDVVKQGLMWITNVPLGLFSQFLLQDLRKMFWKMLARFRGVTRSRSDSGMRWVCFDPPWRDHQYSEVNNSRSSHPIFKIVTVKRWVGSSISILLLQHLGHMYFKEIGFWEASYSDFEHNIIQSLNIQHFFIRLNEKMIFIDSGKRFVLNIVVLGKARNTNKLLFDTVHCNAKELPESTTSFIL